MRVRVRIESWNPVPKKAASAVRNAGRRKTSPWTCFHPYSSPRSFSYKKEKFKFFPSANSEKRSKKKKKKKNKISNNTISEKPSFLS
jgi:hypothetical protein